MERKYLFIDFEYNQSEDRHMGLVSVSMCGLLFLFISNGNAADYSFTWDASPPSDNVVEYRIYYRLNSATYNVSDFETVSITNQKFNPDDPSWSLTLPDVADEYCFVFTAVDNDGFESDFSVEVGKGTTCGRKVHGNNRGGGIRRCFISSMKD